MTNRKKILIVDDSVTNTILLDAILKQEGYKISTEYNVNDALRSIEDNLPDLILLDLFMPRISGFDLLKCLKENNRFSNIPVIIVSAVNTEENINMAKQLGAKSFIRKPIDILDFLDKVTCCLKNYKAAC